jgi:hypothetical protein
VFHWLRTTDHQPYYGALKPLLDTHAERLAKAIDCAWPRRPSLELLAPPIDTSDQSRRSS